MFALKLCQESPHWSKAVGMNNRDLVNKATPSKSLDERRVCALGEEDAGFVYIILR